MPVRREWKRDHWALTGELLRAETPTREGFRFSAEMLERLAKEFPVESRGSLYGFLDGDICFGAIVGRVSSVHYQNGALVVELSLLDTMAGRDLRTLMVEAGAEVEFEALAGLLVGPEGQRLGVLSGVQVLMPEMPMSRMWQPGGPP